MRKTVVKLLFFLFSLSLIGSQVCAATIDIMVLFDTNAKTWAVSNGGMQNVAVAAVAKMNTVLSNSGIGGLNFNLVHYQEVPYTSNSALGNDLDNLSAASGGFSSVPTLRSTYGADLVALLVDTGSDYGNVGIGYQMIYPSGDPNAAYTVCAVRAVALGHTLTHEVGHNLGAGHSKYQSVSPGPNYALNTYSAGWYFTGTNSIDYHTVMAYGEDGYGNSYVEAPYFSTPNRSYMGSVVGHAADGDNSRTINGTMNVIAAYKSATTNVCGTPGALAVPTTDSDGSYQVSWGASATSGAFYTLEEATNGSFIGGVRTAYTGMSTAVTITGRSSGSYFYRVKASAGGYTDSGWRTGSNGCTVTLSQPLAGTPASLTVPTSDSDGSYQVSWGASATAGASYTLEEATNGAFTSGLRTAYTGSSTAVTITGRSSGSYYYRVKASAGGYTDSAWRTGSNGCTVTLSQPVAVAPGALAVPTTDSDGSYQVSWGASATSGALYTLEEATNGSFTSGLRTAYTGSSTAVTITGRSSGSYYYRVKASAGGYTDSAWRTGSNGCTVTLSQPVAMTPGALAVPTTDEDGNFVISWERSTSFLALYVLEEAKDIDFTQDVTVVYQGAGLSVTLSGRPAGTYYYRVKSTRFGLADSEWLVGENGCAVGENAVEPDFTAIDNCVFDWFEATYPEYLAPSPGQPATLETYYYRYYAQSQAYLGTESTGRHLYYLGPLTENALYDLGPVSIWQASSGCQ